MGKPLKYHLAFWLLALLATNAPAWELGAPAPDFNLLTFAGQQVSPTALAGKPLLLVFWNTWCVNCQRELAQLQRLANTYGPRELPLLAINTGINDSERKARDFLQQHGYSFAAGFDHDFSIGQAYRVRGVPTVCLIDAAGVLRYRQAVLPDDLPHLLGLPVPPRKAEN